MRADPRQRRFLGYLTALALVCVLAQAITGVAELALYLTPLFLIASLLLLGHYVAEERIVRFWRASAPRRIRRSVSRVHVERARPLLSLLDGSPLSRRGPPALAPLTA